MTYVGATIFIAVTKENKGVALLCHTPSAEATKLASGRTKLSHTLLSGYGNRKRLKKA